MRVWNILHCSTCRLRPPSCGGDWNASRGRWLHVTEPVTAATDNFPSQPLGWGVRLYFILHFSHNISLLHTFQVCFPISLALNSLSSFTPWMVDLFHITFLFGKLRHSCFSEYYCNYFHPETVIKPPDSKTHWFVLSEPHLISSCFLRWKLNFALLLSAPWRILNKFSPSDI